MNRKLKKDVVILGAGRHVAIYNNCIVGAGAVVIGNIVVCGAYVGVPFRRIK